MKSLRSRIVAGTVLLAAVSAAPGAQRNQTPPLALESMTGRDSFAFYCASCHGATGKGDGPVAPTLRLRPPDLSTLTQRNRGTFPRQQVLDTISGAGRPAAHGSTDMPVWGPIFQSLDRSDTRTTQRLTNIAAFIESLQRPTTLPESAGATLFRTHCASCHGNTGRGNGPMATQLRQTPPDLTKFSARNGGVFPRNRVYDIVDGRGISSHGVSEMPVWGDTFRRAPDAPSDAAVKSRIDAIVGYLESIQERPT